MTVENQVTGRDTVTVTVESVCVPEGGYVAIHDGSLADGSPCTDGDESDTFLDSEGAVEGPYLWSGGVVVASTEVTTRTNDGGTTEGMTDGEMTDTVNETPTASTAIPAPTSPPQ